MFYRALRPRVALLAPLLTSGLFVAADADAPTRGRDPETFSVHEWGTFTSIAGMDGGAVGWTPLSGRDDLPCFVDRNDRHLARRLFADSSPGDRNSAPGDPQALATASLGVPLTDTPDSRCNN